MSDSGSQNYIVLARKWRPTTFEEVVGQEHVTRTLLNALEQNRLGHAFIFAGPRGVGKTTTARLLARAVNTSQDPDPSGSLDIIEIDGASNRGIDEIRNLRENIRFAPVSSSHKIYIIDEVHMLSKEAFNALLKTLEEPPSHAIFIFATTEIHRVPLTILSRCQRFDFKRIPTRLIANQLDKIAKAEKIDIDMDSLLLIARKSDGGMRDATSILDQLASFSEGKITLAKAQESLGVINEELFFRYTELVEQKNSAAVLHFVDELVNSGHDMLNFVQGLEEHLRNLLVVASTGQTGLLEMSDHYKERYTAAAASFASPDLLQHLDMLTHSESMLKFSENPRLILELLLLKIAHKPRTLELEELLKRLNDGSFSAPAAPATPEKKTEISIAATAPAVPPAPPPVNTAPQAATIANPPPQDQEAPPAEEIKAAAKPGKDFERLTSFALPATTAPGQTKPDAAGAGSESIAGVEFSTIETRWPEIVEAVRREKVALGSFLQDGVPYQLESGELQIAFDAKTGFHREHVQKNAATVEGTLKALFGTPLRIQCIKRSFEEEGIKKQVKSPEEIFESMKSKEPVLRMIIDKFECENPE